MRPVSRMGLLAAATALVIGISVVAEAQMSPDAIVAERVQAMKGRGGAMRALTPIVRGEAPWDKEAAIKQATVLVDASKGPIDKQFPPGTGNDKLKTRALPAIWEKPADWQKDNAAFAEAAAKLQQLAQAGDEAGFKAQFAAVGKACGTCHEAFRGPEVK